MVVDELNARYRREAAEKRAIAREAAIAATGITVGTRVRRKRGKANVGVVEHIFTRDTMRDKEWGWRPCDPYAVAAVHWERAVRWLGGKSDWSSTVRLDSLVKVDA